MKYGTTQPSRILLQGNNDYTEDRITYQECQSVHRRGLLDLQHRQKLLLQHLEQKERLLKGVYLFRLKVVFHLALSFLTILPHNLCSGYVFFMYYDNIADNTEKNNNE